MRSAPLILCLVSCWLLAGCAELLGADVASVAVFGRSIGDLVASGVTGRDCSIVRLDKGQSYCADAGVTGREAYCTRTLASVDCWAVPPPGVRLVADTPAPTLRQQSYREARWPKALTADP